MPPVLSLPTWAVVATNVAAWAAIHAGTGWYVHRLPVERLSGDGWLLRARRWEAEGRTYERVLHIKAWKDRVPEAGALFVGGVSKRQLPEGAGRGVERLAVETRRAEVGHWLALAGGPVSWLWNPPAGFVLMVGYGIVANAPFIAIQRYNRQRAQRVLARRTVRSSGSRADVTDARPRRTRGSSIP
ncbi:MAG: hypothetical protein H0W25_04435 [Acidimicrobiia bacterium]|nr:hypothetical protein [Acidimicrobiia bacterium]